MIYDLCFDEAVPGFALGEEEEGRELVEMGGFGGANGRFGRSCVRGGRGGNGVDAVVGFVGRFFPIGRVSGGTGIGSDGRGGGLGHAAGDGVS